jgi:hypothetical protein
MLMENIFDELNLLYYYFNVYDISNDLHLYLYDNLNNENYDTLRWDLRNALTTNANE